MLSEQEKHAKYGWTHCLTLPQAAWMASSYNADVFPAMALAGSFVIGFRRGLARTSWEVPPLRSTTTFDLQSLASTLHEGPEAAVAMALGAAEGQIDPAFRLLPTAASARSDAHLVKYTLACFDGAVSDPWHAAIYLAAAAKLNAIWARDEPLADDSNPVEQG